MRDLVLRATDLSVEFDGPRPTRAVRDVSLELRRGEVLGIAGESGCGKSTLAYALSKLLRPPARIVAGSVEFFDQDGTVTDIAALGRDDLREFRWNRVSMVFQSAMNALNPVTTVERQFADIFQAHRPSMGRQERTQRARELLDMVGIDPDRVRSFPHELSGGMRQRVVIAMALALQPDVVIMDEPTTALDVVVQREILDEIERLRAELGFSIIFITHDLSMLLEISDRLAVMYAGRIVEQSPTKPLKTKPAHPYTEGLLGSFPDLRGERRELHGVSGYPPDLRDDLPGCAFAPRCTYRFSPCEDVWPRLRPPAATSPAEPGPSDRLVACHLHDPEYRTGGSPDSLAGATRVTSEERHG
jgi:peptide/nickel transport system ATP-binding protein